MKVGAMTYAKLCAAMIPGDLTCQELADETGLHYITVLDYTREMHKAGAVHIARYEQDARGRHNIKVYKLGPGRNASRVRMSNAQRQQRMRDKRAAVALIHKVAGVSHVEK